MFDKYTYKPSWTPTWPHKQAVVLCVHIGLLITKDIQMNHQSFSESACRVLTFWCNKKTAFIFLSPQSFVQRNSLLSSFLEHIVPLFSFLSLGFFSLIFKQRIRSTRKAECCPSRHSYLFERKQWLFEAITHLPGGHFSNSLSHGEHGSGKRALSRWNKHHRAHWQSSRSSFPFSYCQSTNTSRFTQDPCEPDKLLP